MIIENKTKPLNIRVRAFLMTLLCAILIIMIYISGLFDKGIGSLEQKHLTYIVLALYLFPSFFFYALNVYYVYIYLDESKLIVRYYSLRPLGSDRKTIKMPLSDLLMVEVKKNFFGLKRKMILYQRVKDKVAVYNPISLSGYGKNEMKKFMDAFNPILKKDKRK